MSDNVDIWSKVDQTDPSGTKTAELGGRIITSINGTYIAKKATELFGPIGIGWGYDIEEDRLDTAGPIFDKKSGEKICDALNHTIRLRFWYKRGEEKGVIFHFGHTKYIYATKYGFTADEEAPKKSVTDAIKKCLSLLGFSADIFLGQFEDYEYVAAQHDREALEKADDKAEEQTKQELEQKQNLIDTLRLMSESVSKSMLEGLYKTAVRKANIRQDKTALRKIKAAKDKKLAEFEAEK